MLTKNIYGGPVYRFFSRENEAVALEQGDVWLSTLERCRAYEDPDQGDSEEAYETYNSGFVGGGSEDQDFVEITRRCGGHVDPGSSNMIIHNVVKKTSISDAYVICTTTEYSPTEMSQTFGKYCVEIKNTMLFLQEVSEQLKISDSRIKKASMGEVIYSKREYTGLESQPGQIGFVKPEHPYATQKEYRFLWEPAKNVELTPFLLKCPKVSPICRRIA